MINDAVLNLGDDFGVVVWRSTYYRRMNSTWALH